MDGIKYLNRAVDENQEFLKEIATLNGVIDEVCLLKICLLSIINFQSFLRYRNKE